MQTASRRWVGRLFQVALVGVAVLVVAMWFMRRVPNKVRRGEIEVMAQGPTAEALGPGDVQIFSRDSAVDLVLQGDKILAGLSPKTVAKVRAELAASTAKETTGLGGSIAQMVRKTVEGAIGTHVTYPVASIRDIRYERGELVLVNKGGGETRLFGDTKVNKEKVSSSFSEADAQRFIEAVRARQQEQQAHPAPHPPLPPSRP